jgi:hypothetical protein
MMTPSQSEALAPEAPPDYLPLKGLFRVMTGKVCQHDVQRT